MASVSKNKMKQESTLGESDVVDGICEVPIISLVELRPETILQRTHALEQESHPEEVDLVLLDKDIHGTLVDECVVDSESSRETGAIDGSGRVDAKLTTTLGNSSIEDFGRRACQE